MYFQGMGSSYYSQWEMVTDKDSSSAPSCHQIFARKCSWLMSSSQRGPHLPGHRSSLCNRSVNISPCVDRDMTVQKQRGGSTLLPFMEAASKGHGSCFGGVLYRRTTG